MNKLTKLISACALLSLLALQSCWESNSCHQQMISILTNVAKAGAHPSNQFYPPAKLHFMDSLLSLPHSTPPQVRYCKYLKANILLEMGKEEMAITLLEDAVRDANAVEAQHIMKDLAVAYLRVGERSNCISNHASESCIMPIKGMGVHQDSTGSKRAIAICEQLLVNNPDDLEVRWILNLAYMTLGDYPEHVPAAYLIPGMTGDTTHKVNPFIDIAGEIKLDVKTMAGGSVVDDFDGDGYFDIITSSMGVQDRMYFFHNNTDGTFSETTAKAGLTGITGGLNMVQADYDNDGDMDVLVLRGAWKREFGKEPNSLLQNNGDGTFTDVTTRAGMLSFHPTQTATWNDFNNDGWLDVFIGNESIVDNMAEQHPSELYINQGDGTFKNIAGAAHCEVFKYVKAATSGDFDHDGWKDIFVSTMNGERRLLKNMGINRGKLTFADVSIRAGIDKHHGNSFSSWFWDYDNDGWLDIFACDYSFRHSLAFYEAAEHLGIEAGNPEKMLLYHNNHDGTFTNVAGDVGLTTNVFAMGGNFGDIDNDGFLDMYLGTGNPDYKSLVPNKLFRNLGGEMFADVTASARVGHLQKGHGVAFADVDNDGDQDIYIEMGGAFSGDAYQNSLFMNPGQGTNNWIKLQLVGTKSNRGAIGSQIKLTFNDNGTQRSVYRDVNSGGSFGASPMRREIGIGQASVIDEIEIRWHGSGAIQRFRNVTPNQLLRITEGSSTLEPIVLRTIQWTLPDQWCLPGATNLITASL